MIFKKLVPSIILLFSCQTFAADSNSIIAVVSDEVITSNDLKNSIDIYEKESKKKIDEKTLQNILERYVDQLLQKQYAQKAEIQILPEVLQRQVNEFAKQYKLSMLDFRKLPEYDLIVQQLNDRATIAGLKSIITKNITEVSATLIDINYQQQLKNQRQYRLFNIILKGEAEVQELSKQLQASPSLFEVAALKHSLAYNAQNKGDLGYRTFAELPEMYQPIVASLSIGHVSDVIPQKNQKLYHLLKLADIRDKPEKLVQQIKIKHIFMPSEPGDLLLTQATPRVLKKMQGIYEQLKNGTKFADLAKIHSEDDYAKTGGELPWININKLPNDGKINFAALSIEEISPPFATKHGWHIIQKIDQRQISPLKLKVQQQLLLEKKNKFYQLWLAKQKAKAFITIYKDKLKQFLPQ